MNRNQGAQAVMLPDGKRLHLNHGPIDLIVEAFGSGEEIHAAYDQAVSRFGDILPTLVTELKTLRRPMQAMGGRFRGPVADRMMKAALPYCETFITPMAAVAGAVADEVLSALTEGRDLARAYVNNGGDIAFHLMQGETLRAGMVGDYYTPAIDGLAVLRHDMDVRGIATSGWKGGSFSLGIADSVTVLAKDAASADVAATLIANAVNINHPSIERAPAQSLDPDSDLGERPVTVVVGLLDGTARQAALDGGREVAASLERAGHIRAAMLLLQDEFRVVGELPVQRNEIDAREKAYG